MAHWREDEEKEVVLDYHGGAKGKTQRTAAKNNREKRTKIYRQSGPDI